MTQSDNNFWRALPRPILALAPMVGITDSAFRQIAKGWGADVVYSEMISADAIDHKAPKALRMLDFDPSEQPFVVQLMGNNPAVMARVAAEVETRGVAGIDINFGCPAHKIARNYCGVMLMRDLDLSRRIIEAVLGAISIPLSIKVRISIKPERRSGTPVVAGSQPITILDMLARIADLPLAAIMVHGRSFEDPFDGGVDYTMVNNVKKLFTNGPVLANGGVTSVESTQEFLAATGADGLGLARSAIGKPWIFKQIRDLLETGSYQEHEWDQIKNALIAHVTLFEQTRSLTPFREIRRHLSHYVRSRPNAGAVRAMLVHADSLADVETALATAQT